MTCFFLVPVVYYVVQPSLLLSLLLFFPCLLLFLSLGLLRAGGHIARAGQITGTALFLWTVNVFKQERRKEAVAYKWNVKTERTRAYLINFQTENSPGRNKWREAAEWREWILQMSRWSGRIGFTGTNLRLVKEKNEQQKICEIVTVCG